MSRELRVTIFGCRDEEAALFREMAPRFGVRPQMIDEAASVANSDLASGTRCVSVDHRAPIEQAALVALHRVGVKYVTTRSVGCNHIDVPFAESLGMAVETVTYSSASVADYTVMLMLMALRRAKSALRRVQSHDYRPDPVCGRELRDMTVGVVGTGRIGTAVLERLVGFGCRVVAHDRHPSGLVEYAPLDDLLWRSDIVTLHTPLTPSTFHLLDRRRFEQMKMGAILINTGRGALVDTDALVDALEGGRIGGVALDVLEGEEEVFYLDHRHRPVESQRLVRLHRMPNAIITPHTAYYTDHALRDIVENTLSNCRRFEERVGWVA